LGRESQRRCDAPSKSARGCLGPHPFGTEAKWAGAGQRGGPGGRGFAGARCGRVYLRPQAGAEVEGKRVCAWHSIYTVSIDTQDKMFSMKNTSSQARAGLEKHFERLRQKLARTGY